MRVVMLKTPWCGRCATMLRILGDKVEPIDITEHPEWLEKTTLTEAPICLIVDDDRVLAEKAGYMPISVFDKWVNQHVDSRC
jgi:hypothetical protein